MRDHAQIRAILPHRHPILLVDRVQEIDYYDQIVATKAITGSEPCYAAIADSTDIRRFAYPRSLMVESFGQSGAVLWLESIRRDGRPALPGTLILAAARDVTFHRAAYPGDTLRHVAQIERIIGDNAFLRGRTWIDDELAADYGSVIAVVRSADSLSPGRLAEGNGNGNGVCSPTADAGPAIGTTQPSLADRPGQIATK